MSILDGLLGGNGNSILDGLLGGSSSNSSASESHFETQLAANPNLDLHASDVLQVGEGGGSAQFTGIGDVGLALGVPIVASISSSEASSSEGSHDGGLLSGLL